MSKDKLGYKKSVLNGHKQFRKFWIGTPTTINKNRKSTKPKQR